MFMPFRYLFSCYTDQIDWTFELLLEQRDSSKRIQYSWKFLVYFTVLSQIRKPFRNISNHHRKASPYCPYIYTLQMTNDKSGLNKRVRSGRIGRI